MQKSKEELKAIEAIVRRLLENIKKENLGINQVVYHQEFYDKERK